MKIGIDARFLTHPQRGGFKTYTENLIGALAEIDAENTYVLYLDRAPDLDTKLPQKPNFVSCIVPGSEPVLGMPLREQVKLARQAARDGLDLLHSPCLTAPLCLVCPLVVTIHDMIWAFPDYFSPRRRESASRRLMRWYYRSIPRLAARQASAILTVSHAAKESLVQHLGLRPDRVRVTYEAASPVYRLIEKSQVQALLAKFRIKSDFILAIGSADPRKNMTALVNAYASLPHCLRDEYELVIVWTHTLLASDLIHQIKARNISDRVQFLTGVFDWQLALLYNAATLFVFPSLYEGFGLPPLEAMACGTPVIASDNSSIPEVVGDAALLVPATNTQSLTKAIHQALTDRPLREDLIQKGLKRSALFSWHKCAYETIGAYAKALEISPLPERATRARPF